MNRLLPACAVTILLVRPAFSQDTVRVTAGWNIVGSVGGGSTRQGLRPPPECPFPK